MIHRLETIGMLSSVYDAILYQYCQLFAETEALQQRSGELEGSADVLEENLKGLDGPELVQCFQEIAKVRQLQSSLDTKVRQSRMAMRQYLVEFGLTPSAISRVAAKPAVPTVDVEKDRLAQLLSVR